ncbi:MAG: hypothetical protein IPK64_21130 [bacterium]|nr:hypothetical protein [bacterium]
MRHDHPHAAPADRAGRDHLHRRHRPCLDEDRGRRRHLGLHRHGLTRARHGRHGWDDRRGRHHRAPRFLVGARFQYGTATSDATDFAVGSALLGVPAFTRLFYAGQSVHTHIGPASTINIVSFKPAQQGADLSSYIGSLCPQDRLVCHHEPEADYTSGAAFLTAWRAARAMSKALRPDIPFGMIAGAFQYRPGNAGAGGTFIPDPGEADFLGLDTYRIGLGAASQTTPQAVNRIDPIDTLPEFVEWLRCTDDRGPRIVTEYNRGLDKDGDGNPLPRQHPSAPGRPRARRGHPRKPGL